MKTIETLVRELADLEAIRDLPVHYCNYLWRKDVDGLLSLFTDDAVYVVQGIEVQAVSRGRAAIKKMHEKALAQTTPRLCIHNQIVNLLGGGCATSRLLGRSPQSAGHHEVDWHWLLRRRVPKGGRPMEVRQAPPRLRRIGR